MANILSKIKKALTPKKGKKKKSSYNTGLSWKLDRMRESKEKYEKAYSPKRKTPVRPRKKAKKA